MHLVIFDYLKREGRVSNGLANDSCPVNDWIYYPIVNIVASGRVTLLCYLITVWFIYAKWERGWRGRRLVAVLPGSYHWLFHEPVNLPLVSALSKQVYHVACVPDGLRYYPHRFCVPGWSFRPVVHSAFSSVLIFVSLGFGSDDRYDNVNPFKVNCRSCEYCDVWQAIYCCFF